MKLVFTINGKPVPKELLKRTIEDEVKRIMQSEMEDKIVDSYILGNLPYTGAKKELDDFSIAVDVHCKKVV